MNYKAALRLTTRLAMLGLGSLMPVGAEAADQADDSAAKSAAVGVGDIIVTAQRRSENLQKVPVTVAALTSDALKSANITTSTELSKVVPGLSITPNSQSVLLYLRGIGSNVTAIGSEASVAFYVDGVYYSRLTPGLMRLNNIERVEVLKGPQGTLYGRNATGGLVNIITRTPKPGAEPTADISIGYGNYRTVDATAYASFSLGEKIAMDISGVVHSQGRGFGTNIHTGLDVNKDVTRAVRSKLVFDAGPDTRFILTGEYNQYSGDFSQNSHFRDKPQGYMDGVARNGTAVLPSLGFFDVNNDWTNKGNGTAWGGSLRIEQDIGFADMSNTLAYHNLKQRNPFDADLSPVNLQHTDLYSYGREVLNDFQLTSKKGSLVDWNVGLFYTDQKQGYNPAIIGLGGDVGNLIVHSNSRVRSIAAYGQARFPIIARLKGTIGLRYTRDKLSGNGSADFGLPDGSATVPGFIPYSGSEQTFKKATFKFVLDYQLTDDIFAYASFSRGFKGATYNVIPFNPVPTKPETLDAYEAGLKTELFDRMLRMNLAGFYYKLKDPQVIVIPNSGAITTENAGSAKVKGGEIDLTLVPVRGLNLRGAATYLDAKYTDYKNAAFYAENPVAPFGNLAPVTASAEGNRLPYAPKFSFNAGGDYTVELKNGGSIMVGTNVSYTGRTFFHPDNRLFQDELTLVDAFLQYKVADTGLSVKVWGQNLTDQKYCTGAVEFGNPAGDICFTGAPRTYGFTMRYQY